MPKLVCCLLEELTGVCTYLNDFAVKCMGSRTLVIFSRVGSAGLSTPQARAKSH